MDCKTARLLLCFPGPSGRELDAVESGELEVHLAGCPDCGPLAETERRLDAHLGRALRAVPVPAGLRATLLTRLGAERDAFYRRGLVRIAGVAALVLLAVGLSWFWLSRPPGLELEEIQALASTQIEAAPAEVDDWLRQVGGRQLSAPPQFQYAFLVAHGLDQIKGRQVPFLLFVRPAEPGAGACWARVYILGDRTFNLEDLRDSAPGVSGKAGSQALVLRHPENEHVTYVVLFTGELGPFLQGPPGGVTAWARPDKTADVLSL